jgi:hypothetical protein
MNIKGTRMIQFAHYNTGPLLVIANQLEINFFSVDDENEASKYQGPMLLGLDESTLNAIIKIISSRGHPVIVVINEKQNYKLVPKMKMLFGKIFGFIDLNSDVEMAVPLVQNYINLNFSNASLSLEKLSHNLASIEENTKSELRGIKELYDRFVKMRMEKIKGAELFIKFMAGERSGGEFFDYIEKDSQMLFIQAGSDSYLMSSLIISAMEDLKIKTIDLYLSIDSFIASLKHQAEEHNAHLSYTIMILKLKTMEASIYGHGNAKIFYNNEIISVDSLSTMKLKRGAKITFISEGTLKNWNINSNKTKLLNLLTDNLDMNNKDFINEIFFELARHKKGMFLSHDALVAMLEINENIIHQL